MRFVNRRALRVSIALMPLLGTLGCMRAPSFNVLGSYFPGWIACLVLSVVITAVLRWIANRTGLEQRLPMLPLFYLSLALLIACLLWLIAFE